MTDQSDTDRQRRDPIHIVPYDPGWPAAFEQQRSRVESALRPWLVGPVEHIGSTSVPGLAAKPIIDMLARTPDYRTGDIIEAMSSIGWAHAPEPGDEQSRKWSFCFPDVSRRTHHLHIFEAAPENWQPLLAFRDHLRRHPDAAAEYGQIKKALAAADAHDRPRYRTGKAPFIQELLRKLNQRAATDRHHNRASARPTTQPGLPDKNPLPPPPRGSQTPRPRSAR